MNKKIYPFLSFLIIFAFNNSYAQFSKNLSVGAGAGGTTLFGDLRYIPVGYAGHLDVDYLISPFISVGVNAQSGKLSANDSYGRDSENKYKAVNGNIKVRAGQFFVKTENYSYYMLSNKGLSSYLANIYLGAGLGFLKNNVEAQWPDINGTSDNLTYENHSTELIVPLNVGIDIPFGSSLYGPTWAINLNYQHSFASSDNLDGFVSPYSSHNDQYSYWSLAVKVGLFNRKK